MPTSAAARSSGGGGADGLKQREQGKSGSFHYYLVDNTTTKRLQSAKAQDLIDSRCCTYMRLPDGHKKSFVNDEIISVVKNENGLFLKEDEATGVWFEVPLERDDDVFGRWSPKNKRRDYDLVPKLERALSDCSRKYANNPRGNNGGWTEPLPDHHASFDGIPPIGRDFLDLARRSPQPPAPHEIPSEDNVEGAARKPTSKFGQRRAPQVQGLHFKAEEGDDDKIEERSIASVISTQRSPKPLERRNAGAAGEDGGAKASAGLLEEQGDNKEERQGGGSNSSGNKQIMMAASRFSSKWFTKQKLDSLQQFTLDKMEEYYNVKRENQGLKEENVDLKRENCQINRENNVLKRRLRDLEQLLQQEQPPHDRKLQKIE